MGQHDHANPSLRGRLFVNADAFSLNSAYGRSTVRRLLVHKLSRFVPCAEVGLGSNLAARFQSRERPESVLPADRSTSREGLDFDESTAVDPTQKPAARSNSTPSCDTSSMSVIWAATPWEGRGPATARPRIISAYSSTCSDMASASSTSMPR